MASSSPSHSLERQESIDSRSGPPGVPPSSMGLRRLAARLVAIAFRPGSLAVADQAVVSAGNFATSILLGRFAPQHELGIYVLALSLVYFIRGLQEQLVSAPFLIYAQRRRDDELPLYVGSVVAHQVAMSLAALVALGAVAGVLSAGYGPRDVLHVLPALFAVVPLFLFRDFVRQFSFARFEPAKALAVDVVIVGVQAAGLIALAWRGALTATTTYLVLAGSCAVGCAGWLTLRRPRMMFDRRAIAADWRENWAFGRWAAASQLIGCSVPYVMPWIVATAYGEVAAGILGASATLIGIANMFVLGISHSLSPRAARAFQQGGPGALRDVLEKTALLFAVTLGGFWVATYFAGDRVLALVYGDRFVGGGIVMCVLAANLLVSGLGIVAGNGLWAMNRPAANFASDVAALAVSLSAAWWLVPTLGVTGSALATLAGTSAGVTARMATMHRALHRAQREAAAC